jgi:hypothetical protein
VHTRDQVYIRLRKLRTIRPGCMQPLDVDKEGDGRIPEIERLFQSSLCRWVIAAVRVLIGDQLCSSTLDDRLSISLSC